MCQYFCLWILWNLIWNLRHAHLQFVSGGERVESKRSCGLHKKQNLQYIACELEIGGWNLSPNLKTPRMMAARLTSHRLSRKLGAWMVKRKRDRIIKRYRMKANEIERIHSFSRLKTQLLQRSTWKKCQVGPLRLLAHLNNVLSPTRKSMNALSHIVIG